MATELNIERLARRGYEAGAVRTGGLALLPSERKRILRLLMGVALKEAVL
jgi:hypothetical protein